MSTLTNLFTPNFMLLQTTFFLTTWLTLHLLVATHGPYPSISTLTKYNSRFYSLISLLLFLLIISPFPSHDVLAREAYHLSKMYEYLDIFGVVLSGGKVDLHFGVHHATTVWLTWVRVLREGCEGWKWFAGANAAHHVLMYAYFGGWNGERVRRVLLVTGQGQLVAGMVVDAVVGWGRWNRGEEVWRMGVSGGLLGLYMGLSLRELRVGRRVRAGEVNEEVREEVEGVKGVKGE
ncbi:hypothetical protein B0T16DRAFT_450795 [Cercophora newfieldiana]|uniref:Very-long-chain 3-oxoacyl-CoA synthase n=1 Tax=Cercophora newfieldiana TaxID=92897 RepID=A0AA40CXI6_9PEZI|nr:hypothetical protein B0T16DRAFT_450795 [Cercophora newfieldiana]